MKNSIYLVLFLVACKSSDKAPAPSAKTVEAPAVTPVACETGALAYDKQRSIADGFGEDQSQPAIDAAKKAILGKQLAFKDCGFGSQGGDSIHFTAGDKRIQCEMAGGEKGLDQFRQEAMKLDMAKLKLDIVATVAEHDGHIELTGCKIKPHE